MEDIRVLIYTNDKLIHHSTDRTNGHKQPTTVSTDMFKTNTTSTNNCSIPKHNATNKPVKPCHSEPLRTTSSLHIRHFSSTSISTRSVIIFVLCLCHVLHCSGFNLDLPTATVHTGDPGSMFGYSVAQHKDGETDW